MRTLNKEEMLAVYIALMICRQLGYPKPPKHQVLNVVESWRLIKFSAGDLEIVSSGEPKWRNDLAWARKDLVQRAWVKNREINEWELSELGIEKILLMASKWAQDVDADASKLEATAASSERLTREAWQQLYALGRGEKMKRII